MEVCAVSLLGIGSVPLWLFCIALAVIVLLIVFLLVYQCRKAAAKKRCMTVMDWSGEAQRQVEFARVQIETGLLDMLRQTFGSEAPQDLRLLQQFLSGLGSNQTGGQYVFVESLASILRGTPELFLQGSDLVGGVSVLPIRLHEKGEKYLYLEGLSFCFRREAYQYTRKYNLRFLPGKAGRPIEEVLEFECCE